MSQTITTCDLTEEQTIQAIKQGNERAFEQLFKDYYGPLCRYAFSMLKNEDDAEEIVQKMFVAFWEKRASIYIEQSLKSYLYRAVHNHCLNYFKHLKTRALHQDYVQYYEVDSVDDVAEVVAANELQYRLTQAIEKLPTQCALVFKMNRMEGLRYQEIADKMSLSVKTVENHIGKALKILRVELAEFLTLLAAVLNL